MHSTTRMRDSSGLESIAFDPEISKPEPLQFDTSAQSIQRDHDADAPEVAAVADGSDAPMVNLLIHITFTSDDQSDHCLIGTRIVSSSPYSS